jgi:hypothetical protein
MALLYKRRVFAYAIETTPGTAVSLTGDTCFCFDPVITPEIPMHERPATGSLSKLVSVPGGRKAKFTCSVELAGGGTSVPPAWASLLTCCGMVATSNSYALTSSQANYHTATIGLYEDGRFKTMAGCQGTISLDAKAGEAVMLKFEFTGVWIGPTDVALPTLPAYAVIPPRFASATFTIASYTPKISKFSLELGNKVSMIEDITTVSAYSRAIITDRGVKGKIDPLGDLVANYDCYGQWIAGTAASLSLVVGSVTDNTITITAPHVQIASISPGNREDLVADEQDFICAASSAGDDELTIAFS